MSTFRNYSDLLFNRFPKMWKTLGWRETSERLIHCVYRKVPNYYLEMQLSSIKESGGNRSGFVVALATDEDICALEELAKNGEPRVRSELEPRMRFLRQGFRNLYVTRSREGQLSFIQCIIYPSENDTIAKHASRTYYPLKPYQVMIEKAYAFPKARAFGAAEFGTVELLKLARQKGFRQCCTYVSASNISSMNFATGVGFKIRKLLWEYTLLGMTTRKLT